MTLHGNRHEDNRRVWNAWVGQVLGDEQKQAAAEHAQVPLEELCAWNTIGADVEQAYLGAWSTRNPADPVPRIPDPRFNANFAQTLFANGCPLNAEGMVFSRSSFQSCEFHTMPDFTRAYFCHHVSFTGAVFCAGARFDSTVFQSSVSFSSAKFLMAARFAGTRFSSARTSVDFREAEFGRPFDRAPRSDGAVPDEREVGTSEFTRAIFNYFTLFNGARFHHNLEFRETVFNANVSFHGTHCFSAARFEDTTFKAGAAFGATRFLGTTEFFGNRFVGHAGFAGACFARGCRFSGGIFDAHAHFTDAQFEDDSAFTSLEFNGHVRFEGTRFGKTARSTACQVDFSGSAFHKPVSFRGAHFVTRYPILAGTLLHERVFFSDTPRLWPKVGALGRELKRGTVPLGLAKESCSVIRHSLANQGLPEAAHFFFRREMRFAMRDAHWLRKVPYLLYWILSDFGHSIVRPSLGLLALFGLSWLALSTCPSTSGDGCPEPWQHALLNTVGIFASARQYYPECGVEGLKPILSTLQSITSFVLLFLLGLGLRQRFRLR